MNTVYHKLFKISEEEKALLINEISKNEDLYNPLKVSFGQYIPKSLEREIVAIRSFNSQHDKLKYPFNIETFGMNAAWNEKSKMFPFTKKFAEDLCKKLKGKGIGKVMYARIPPDGTINWHTDSYPLYSSFARVHVPIISHAGGSTFYTEYGNFVMEEDYVYVYDTKPNHTTKNNSSYTRTHLIIDVLIDREQYFDPVYFLIERVENISFEKINNCLNSENFKETISKLATLLFYFNIHTDGTITLLWNSKGSRSKFFEYCNLTFGENSTNYFEEILWNNSYKFVKDDVKLPGVCHIIRNDFKCE